MTNLRPFALALTLTLSAPALAFAQEAVTAPAPPAAQADPEVLVASRFERTLSYYGDQDRRSRWLRSGLLLGFGSAYVGAALLTLPDSPEPVFQYTLLGIGVASLGLSVVPLFQREPMERLRDEYLTSLRMGVGPVAAMQRAEASWARMADSERSTRRLIGWGAIVAGASALVAAPVYTLLNVDDPLRQQNTLLIFGIAGVGLIGGGVAALTIQGSLEQSLRAWQIGQGRASNDRIRVGAPTLAVRGDGVTVGLQGTF